MYRNEISTRLSRGMSTPAMRAILLAPLAGNRQWTVSNGRRNPRLPIADCRLPRSSLSLLVPRIFADDPDHAVAADHLALLTARLYRRLNFHVTPRKCCQQSAITLQPQRNRLTSTPAR